MSNLNTPAHLAVKEALERGSSLTRAELRSLREKSERNVKLYKLLFWVALGIFNLVLWVELPIAMSRNALIAIGVIALAVAFTFPILGIRKHNRCLALLETVEPGPKKSRASEAGKDYIEQAKKDGRTFTIAEVEVLEASRVESEAA